MYIHPLYLVIKTLSPSSICYSLLYCCMTILHFTFAVFLVVSTVCLTFMDILKLYIVYSIVLCYIGPCLALACKTVVW